MSIFDIFKRKKRPSIKPSDLARLRSNAKAKYDSLRDRRDRPPRDISMELTRTEQAFRGQDRVYAYHDADQLYDNDAIGSTLDTCIRLTLGQQGGYPAFLDDSIQAQFDAWKGTCGWQEGEHWHDMLALILRAVKLHGDCLVLCDKDITGGKVRVWDADQICSINPSDFQRECREHGWYDGEPSDDNQYRQVEGVVTDTQGRVKGWYVTGLRNRTVVGIDDATFIPATLGRLVKRSKYITQYRGEPIFLANAELTADTRSLIKSEVCAAANSAQMPLVVEMASTGQTGIGALLEGITPEELTDGTDISPDDLGALTQAAVSEETFKAYQGRATIAMVPNGTKVQSLAPDRPSAQVSEWMDTLADENGKRMGVMSCLSRGRADNSYSSGQIELEISWAAFHEDQKMLERQVVDYVMQALYPGASYVVTWPRVMEIDPEKAQKTLDAELAGGRTTYKDILGPNWEKKLTQLSEEKKLLEKLGLTNMSFFQGKSGGQLLPIPEQEDIDG